MPDPAWPSSPPEANYLRLVGSGAAGTGTTLASAAAWQALVVSNEVAASASAANTAATGLNFQGVGGAASGATATGLNAALHLLAGWVQAKPPIAASAVAAYEAAVSSMIPAQVSLANRAEQAADVALNPLVLGALTPAIVALDLVYFGEHWPHNAGAGAAYGSALTALLPALAVPPPPAPPGASPAAPATAAAAVAETAGQSAAGVAMQQSGQVARVAADGSAVPAQAGGPLGQAVSSLAQPLQSMLQPLVGMFQGPAQVLSGLPQSMLGRLTGGAGPGGGQAGVLQPGMAAGPGGLGAAGGAGAAPSGHGSVGAAGGGATGGAAGAGLTSYTRPTSTFAPEHGGRPVSLKPGLLSAEFRAPTTGTAGAPVPVAPGMLGSSKDGGADRDVRHARIVVSGDHAAKTIH